MGYILQETHLKSQKSCKKMRYETLIKLFGYNLSKYV